MFFLVILMGAPSVFAYGSPHENGPFIVSFPIKNGAFP
jgi:hypothetical protein